MRATTTQHRLRRALSLVVAVGATLMLTATATAASDAAAVTADFAAQVAAGPNALDQRGQQAIPALGTTNRLQAVTANSGFLYDAIGDDEGLAPDLVQMLAFTSDDGRYTVGIGLTSNALIPGDFVATYVDIDGNAATGSPVFGGADLAVGILGQSGTDVVGASLWNGSSFQSVSLPSLISFPSGTTDQVWSISASDLGIAPGTPTSLYFGSSYSGVYDDYFDFAPEPGGIPLAFTTGALSGPPPAPVAPVIAPSAPTTAVPTPGGTTATSPLRPVAVRSLSFKTDRSGLKMRLGWVKGEGVVFWTARLRARVNGRLQTRTASGSGSAGTRNVLRLIRLPASWKGRPVSVQVQVDDNIRTIVRSRTIVY